MMNFAFTYTKGLLIGLIAALLFISCPISPQLAAGASTGKVIYDVTTDKSMYRPEENVELRIDLKNRTGATIINGRLEITVRHLEKQIGNTITRTLQLNNNADQMLVVNWQAPSSDFKGYLLEVNVRNEEGALLDSDTAGVDVSSTWTKFPRYGYVWDFRQNVNTAERIDKLKNYHINALQYYDWKYRHHKPVADNLEIWDDWSGRPVYGDTVRGYIANAKQMNMVNMAYNMVYAATTGYGQDGVNQDWALYYADDNPRGTGPFSFKMSDSTPTGVTHLYFFNMANEGWRNYIFNQQQKVFQSFAFDGWHGDTVGEWGKMKTASGETLYVKDTYKDFLNAAKSVIGSKYLVFNPVGAQGIEAVNASNVDVIYAEIWPWDRDSEGQLYDTYGSLKKEIEQSRIESGGKSLVVPAYMSYDYGEAHPGQPFNTAAVMLTSSTVYAAGGSRMELGDNGNMLSNEYFPAQNLYMTAELQSRVSKLYDFIVAYENLLRDGQSETANRIDIQGYASSNNGEANKIWTFAKQDSSYEMIHLINLLGVSSNDWRANNGHKETPQRIENAEIKYYYSRDVNSIWLASPDRNDGRTEALSFTKGTDANGNYVKFTVPSLEYWDLIYMSGESNGHEANQGVLINGGFESGDLTGWLATGSNIGIDSHDAADGAFKCYFWSTAGYQQKLEQSLEHMPNGLYTVTAKVKQNTGTPTLSRMELTGYGGAALYTNISHSSAYETISATVNITNQTLNIAFYQAAPANTNLQIDSVIIEKQ